MYPMLKRWVSFRRIDSCSYMIHDWLQDRSLVVDSKLAQFARKLNGKWDPYKLDPELGREEVDSFIERLESAGVLRKSRVLEKSLISTMYTLWQPKQTKALCALSLACNFMLKLTWLPVLCLGLWLNRTGMPDIMQHCSPADILVGLIVGIFAGGCLHEIGHMFSGISNGARVYELGVTFSVFSPGAYVLMNYENVKSEMKLAEIFSAGIRANFLLAGLFLTGIHFFSQAASILSVAFAVNICLALYNMCFSAGMDGRSIISAYLGTKKLFKEMDVLLREKTRSEILKKGITGKVIFADCLILIMIQFTLPLLQIIFYIQVIKWIL